MYSIVNIHVDSMQASSGGVDGEVQQAGPHADYGTEPESVQRPSEAGPSNREAELGAEVDSLKSRLERMEAELAEQKERAGEAYACMLTSGMQLLIDRAACGIKSSTE